MATMASLAVDFDADVSPVVRSREENQERAFVAASRRKDRSLDARLESANRASLLHKKRTGKALRITKEIVENEAMYEEVDERCHEKRLRMLTVQNNLIEEQFQRQLLAAFAAGASMRQTARTSPDGGIRKMRIDIHAARNFLTSHHQQPIASAPAPRTVNPSGFVPSPTSSVFGTIGSSATTETSYVQTPGSSFIQTPEAYPNGLPQLSFPDYLDPSQSPTWMSPHTTPQSQQLPTHPQSVTAWRQQVFQRTYATPENEWRGHPSRERLASAPGTLTQPQPSEAATPNLGYSQDLPRAQSEPSHPQPVFNEDNGQTLLATDLLTSLPQDQDIWSTPELTASPVSSRSSPISSPDSPPKQPVMVSTEEVDPDYDEFSRYAYGIESASLWLPSADTTAATAFDDFMLTDSPENNF